MSSIPCFPTLKEPGALTSSGPASPRPASAPCRPHLTARISGVDIYSVGVMFFELLTRFGSLLERALAFEELRDKGPPDGWKGDYEGDRELYDRMTSLKPADRPSVDEILMYIQQHRGSTADMGNRRL
uniref:Protein kinase domain-containing protein n=1 Tax=Aegilops tauschii subsp. strangulata TaxID=200361 RepID=A0A453T0P8_AEGTS